MKLIAIFFLGFLISCSTVVASAQTDLLRAGFSDPPESARPLTWWHWLNGNVTKDGIAKDLNWMAKIGLGGVQTFDASLSTPQIVEKRLVYMTPEWQDAFRFAVKAINTHGQEFGIASSPGWSETGGPWVPPQDGMKKLVWSTTVVTGGKRCECRLQGPPSTTGPFQTLTWTDPMLALKGGEPKQPPTYYQDIGVLAVPLASTNDAEQTPRATSSDGRQLDGAALTDDSLDTGVELDRSRSVEPGLILTYAKPRSIQSATIFSPGVPPFGEAEFQGILEAKEFDAWHKVAALPLTTVPTTVSFASVMAREFRLLLVPNPIPKQNILGAGAPGAVEAFMFSRPAGPIRITQLQLSSAAKVDRFEAKAGFDVISDYYALNHPAEVVGVESDKVVWLADRIKSDGTLDWVPPKGLWRLIRLGYSLTGATNHPATPEATGFEVDKYDGLAVRRYLEHYIQTYVQVFGAEQSGMKGIGAMVNDSTEVGPSNWTPDFIAQFLKLRGYDPRPWLPAVTGMVMGSRAQSDAFLYDFRRTLADLTASEHYGTLATVAHEHHLKLYGEALEYGRPSLGDDIAMRSHADIPMAALWAWQHGDTPRSALLGDLKGASSVAHLYGKNIVAAESLTSANAPWAFAPSDLRRSIDLEFAYGINLPVIHTSVHQPVDYKVPGLSLDVFGQYFTRLDTWASMARPWIEYIARTAFMLQQGRNVADVAYFYGEEKPLTVLFSQAPPPDIPKKYAYDFVNADALTNVISVQNGELVARSGARYKALYLGGTSDRMTLPTLRRIAELAIAGATIIGEAPKSSPSLHDDATEFAGTVHRLWSGARVTKLGLGRVIAGYDIDDALGMDGIHPDCILGDLQPSTFWVHRQLEDGEIYFVGSQSAQTRHLEARFQVIGRRPEIWHADTGATEPVSYTLKEEETIVPLEFGSEDSFFVVFREPAEAMSWTASKPAFIPMQTLSGPWKVSFQPNRGAPASTLLEALGSLSEQPDPGIRYFSGIATYTKHFRLTSRLNAGVQLWLDLGKIGDVAEVRVNGTSVGTVWKAPYRVDVSGALRSGANELEIRVADLWVNRLIGDAQPNAKRITFTTLPTYNANAPLRPSGLIGPVQLVAARKFATARILNAPK